MLRSILIPPKQSDRGILWLWLCGETLRGTLVYLVPNFTNWTGVFLFPWDLGAIVTFTLLLWIRDSLKTLSFKTVVHCNYLLFLYIYFTVIIYVYSLKIFVTVFLDIY